MSRVASSWLTVPSMASMLTASIYWISHNNFGDFPVNFYIFMVPKRAASGWESKRRNKTPQFTFMIGIEYCPWVSSGKFPVYSRHVSDILCPIQEGLYTIFPMKTEPCSIWASCVLWVVQGNWGHWIPSSNLSILIHGLCPWASDSRPQFAHLRQGKGFT